MINIVEPAKLRQFLRKVKVDYDNMGKLKPKPGDDDEEGLPSIGVSQAGTCSPRQCRGGFSPAFQLDNIAGHHSYSKVVDGVRDILWPSWPTRTHKIGWGARLGLGPDGSVNHLNGHARSFLAW